MEKHKRRTKTVLFRLYYEDPKNIKVELPGMGAWSLEEAEALGLVVPEEVGGNIVLYKTSTYFEEVRNKPYNPRTNNKDG